MMCGLEYLPDHVQGCLIMHMSPLDVVLESLELLIACARYYWSCMPCLPVDGNGIENV